MSKNRQVLWVLIPLGVLLGSGYWFYTSYFTDSQRTQRVLSWINESEMHPQWLSRAGEKCGNAPFELPTDRFIGFLWDDSNQIGHRHQGIDIFSGTDGNITPVFAAYPGFLTRLPDWKSSVIIRIPDDPLQPGRQIWIYYTHMAGPSGDSYISGKFPPGTQEVLVQAGELLGYQGNYSGEIGNPTGVHLHFSIVLNNGDGRWLNELDIENTLDPSPYFGLTLDANDDPPFNPICANPQ
jgi:hypothetical protein